MVNAPRFDINAVVKELHDQPHKAVIYATGAGAGLQQLLWDVAGTSRTVLDAAFPYHPQACEDIIGRKPTKSCSYETAFLLAGAAYTRAMEIAQKNSIADPLIGLGLTAAVATDRTRKGDDRVYAAVKTADNIFFARLTFDKNITDRQSAGAYCDQLGLNLLLCAAGLGSSPNMPHGYKTAFDALLPADTLSVLGKEPLLHENGLAGPMSDLDPSKHVIFPVSANPLHYGHIAVSKSVEKWTGKQTVFSITTDHPEKGKLPREEIGRRMRQFAGISPVLISEGDGLYVEKSRRLPRYQFIIGADAALGMLNPKYYRNGENGVYEALETMRANGTCFYVLGRSVSVNGEHLNDGSASTMFFDVEDVRTQVPDTFKCMFEPVPGRWDISSTSLRNK